MRRALAWTIDCLPLVLWALWALPSLVVLVLARREAAEQVGIFDPSTGADPALLAHLRDLRVVLLGAIVWIAVEMLSRARRGRSIGEALAGLAPAPSRRRGFMVDAVRYGLLLGWIATAAAAPHLLRAEPADPASFYVPAHLPARR